MPSCEISVVIPTYNRLDFLKQVVTALENQIDVPEFEVIAVDDGSSDGTSDWLVKKKTNVPFPCWR